MQVRSWRPPNPGAPLKKIYGVEGESLREVFVIFIRAGEGVIGVFLRITERL